MTELIIERAGVQDADELFEMIRELCVFEKLEHRFLTSAAVLRTHLLGEAMEALIARIDGSAVGYAVYCRVYHTFSGVWLYLDDLYVRPDNRGSGLGKALLKRVADVAWDKGYSGIEWMVLDWNTPAVDFYESIGATVDKDFWTERVSGRDAIAAFRERVRR